MKKTLLWASLIIVVSLLVVGGSVGVKMMPYIVSTQGPPATLTDIAYAPADPVDSKGHLLDLYIPESNDLIPVVIWTGGSGWLMDNGKDTAAWLAPALHEAGFALAGVSVRSSSQITFPGQLHDIKSAIRWLRVNGEEYGIDGAQIAVIGDSSGGWATAMAGVTGDVPSLEGSIGTTGVSSAVQAVVPFYPPTRFIEMDSNTLKPCTPNAGAISAVVLGFALCHDDENSPESQMIGCPIQACVENTLLADPTQYISEEDPPFLILHGESDLLVPHAQGKLLYDALSEACHDATFISLPKAGHGPAPYFLSDDETRENSTKSSTSSEGCSVVASEQYEPDIDTIVQFLKQAFETP